MGWFRRRTGPEPAGETDDPRAALGSTLTADRSGGTTLEVVSRRPLTGAAFPGVRGVVLREGVAPPELEESDGWSVTRSYRCSESRDVEVLYRATFLLCGLGYLGLGEVYRNRVPVPPPAIAGLLLGSRTDRVWLDDGSTATWLVNADDPPRLGDAFDQIGTDPRVRIVDLDTTGAGVRLVPREVVRLSDLPAEDDEG